MGRYLDKPFSEVFKELIKTQKISYKKLSEEIKRIDENGKGLSDTYLHGLAHGKYPPTLENLEWICQVLGQNPMLFKEYRILKAQEEVKDIRLANLVLEASKKQNVFTAGSQPGKGYYKCLNDSKVIYLESNQDKLPECPKCQNNLFSKESHG